MSENNKITQWLEKAPASVFSVYAIFAAFTTYFCMYAFRKPFAVATFEGVADLPFLPPIDYKILLIITQVIGYCLSKFIGIKVISEMGAGKRALTIITVIGFAELALLLFAITPKPYNFIFLFFNGLPLGMVWGLVFGFLEGRKLSELLGAGLSGSYIVASGFVKTVGKYVMDWGVSEFWMPFVTGMIFAPLFVTAVWLLSKLPPPSQEDEEMRTKRAPMDGKTRLKFFTKYAFGLTCLTALYILLTACRDFRDNFAREIWDAVGYSSKPEIMTTSEIPIAICVLTVLALLMLIKSNRRALMIIHLVMMGGTALIGISTFLYQIGSIGPAAWMIMVGLGMYIAYVPYGCVLFDRLIATVGFVGTAGFFIYVTDAFGYLGSVGLLLYKNFGQSSLSWLDFFIGFCYVTSIACTTLFFLSFMYFSAWGAITEFFKKQNKLENKA